MSTLSKEALQEFGALLLLDHLMRYELLQVEKVELEDIIDQLENGVAELKKGFFRSDEQEQELSYEKEELREAKKALSELEQEMEENRHCRLNIALAETDDEGLEPLLNFMESLGTLTLEEDNYYRATDKGHEVYQTWLSSLRPMSRILKSMPMWTLNKVFSVIRKRICLKVINGQTCGLQWLNTKGLTRTV